MFSSIGGNINGVKQMVEPQLLNSNQDTIVIGSYGAHRVTSQQDLIATLPGHFFVVYNVGNNPGHIGYVDSQLTEDGKFIVYDANYNFQGLNQNGVRKVIADGRIRTTILTPDEFIKKYGNVGDKHTSQIAIILTQQEAIDLINQSQQSSPPTTTSQPIQIPTIVQQLNNQSSLSNELNLPSTYVPRDLVPVDQTLFAKNGIFNTQLWKGRNTYKISKQALPYLIAFLKDAQSQGYYLLITDTYRSYELQQEIHKQNPETSAPAGHSQHQTGLAFDIYIIKVWQKLSPHLPPISSPPYSPLKRNPQ